MNPKPFNTRENYTNYIDELVKDIAKNMDENIRKEIKKNIENINWDEHFNRTCGYLLRNGTSCITLVKPGYNLCQRHLNTKSNKKP